MKEEIIKVRYQNTSYHRKSFGNWP